MTRSIRIEAVAAELVDSSLAVHRALGPGLLESIYQQCLLRELAYRGMDAAVEVPFPISYRGEPVDAGVRVDMIVEGLIVVENKAVLNLHPVYEAQLLTYLKLTGLSVGFLINWNVPLIKDGIKRMVNKL